MTKLYSFTVTEEILAELETMLNKHMDKMIDRPLRSRKILDTTIRQQPFDKNGREPNGESDREPEEGSGEEES